MLKFRVGGGKVAIINAYAPHGGKPFDERLQLYRELAELYSCTSCHDLKLVCGDLNARLQKRLVGEEAVLGDQVSGCRLYTADAADELTRLLWGVTTWH